MPSIPRRPSSSSAPQQPGAPGRGASGVFKGVVKATTENLEDLARRATRSASANATAALRRLSSSSSSENASPSGSPRASMLPQSPQDREPYVARDQLYLTIQENALQALGVIILNYNTLVRPPKSIKYVDLSARKEVERERAFVTGEMLELFGIDVEHVVTMGKVRTVKTLRIIARSGEFEQLLNTHLPYVEKFEEAPIAEDERGPEIPQSELFKVAEKLALDFVTTDKEAHEFKLNTPNEQIQGIFKSFCEQQRLLYNHDRMLLTVAKMKDSELLKICATLIVDRELDPNSTQKLMDITSDGDYKPQPPHRSN